ncbi:aspartic peptidase domain-containing protein [Lipomyces chichibuensis]|uniref:aspartic peptidase domain-containing protein n=1 Tax=Lipomyces chichibuensis TaxID=1546026 RepID=UPI003343B066
MLLQGEPPAVFFWETKVYTRKGKPYRAHDRGQVETSPPHCTKSSYVSTIKVWCTMPRHYLHSPSGPPANHTWMIILLLCLLLDLVHSKNDDAPLQYRQTDNTVLLPIEAVYHAPRSRLVKEFDVLAESAPAESAFATPYNDRWKYAYLANITIGTPPQTVALQLDSKGLEIWVQSSANPGCRNTDLEFCAISKFYNRSESTTAKSTSLQGTLLYDDSTYARVLAVQDVATIGDKQVPSLIFGVSTESTAIYGRLGLGRSEKTSGGGPHTLQNVMLDYGLINVTAYSLWLDDHETSTGAILFGGVDKSKFEGELIKVDIAPIAKHIPNRYYIDVATIAVNVGGKRSEVLGKNGRGFPIELDPTSSWSLLPFYLGSRLASKIGGTTYNENLGAFMIDCERRLSNDFVEFGFTGIKISVKLKQLVSKVGDTADGTPICALAFTALRPRRGQVIHASEYSIGDSVLRSAYIVYDLQNKVVSIAKRASSAKFADIYTLNSTGVPAGLIGQPETPLVTTGSIISKSYPDGTILVVFLVVLIVAFNVRAIYKHRKQQGLSMPATDLWHASLPKRH